MSRSSALFSLAAIVERQQTYRWHTDNSFVRTFDDKPRDICDDVLRRIDAGYAQILEPEHDFIVPAAVFHVNWTSLCPILRPSLFLVFHGHEWSIKLARCRHAVLAGTMDAVLAPHTPTHHQQPAAQL